VGAGRKDLGGNGNLILSLSSNLIVTTSGYGITLLRVDIMSKETVEVYNI